MGQSPQNWSSIVERVEQANISTFNTLKQQARDLNRLYLVESDRKLDHFRAEKMEQQTQKQSQRNMVDTIVSKQRQKQSELKRENMAKQKAYREENQMIMARKRYKTEESHPLQNPFVKLVDGQDKRKQQQRLKRKLHNETNKAQGRINLDRIKLNKQSEEQMKMKFIEHMDLFYRKKEQDRKNFQQKYLKLSNPERAAYGDSADEKASMEKQYESVLQRQIKEKKSLRRQDERVDGISQQINRHIDTPGSSPAYIGRIPTQSDRKKQLEYLERPVKNLVTKRVRTEGDIQNLADHEKRSYQSQRRGLPSLQRTDSRNRHQSHAKPTGRIRLNTEPVYNEGAVKPEPNALQQIHRKLQDCPSQREKRTFMTYDILQGKKKYVVM